MKMPQTCRYCEKDLSDPTARHLPAKKRVLFSLAIGVKDPQTGREVLACPFCRRVIWTPSPV